MLQVDESRFGGAHVEAFKCDVRWFPGAVGYACRMDCGSDKTGEPVKA